MLPFEKLNFHYATVEQQVERALSLSLAALLGDDVYNFGELVRIITFGTN